MTDISGKNLAAQRHCDAFLHENADPDIRRPAHNITATPLDALAQQSKPDDLAADGPKQVSVRRAFVTLIARRTSFDVWAALANLEELLSDYRRIAPRFHFMQTTGDAPIAAGNEYRLTLSDPAQIAHTNSALESLSGNVTPPPGIDRRVMDVRVVRTGPWGGETGDLVMEALRNHALAGASSLWVLAHDDADDGNMRVTLDALEITRWAWAPDFLAAQRTSGDVTGPRIMDWDYLFERLALQLDGTPLSAELGTPFSIDVHARALTDDDRIAEALKVHSGLFPFIDQIKTL